MPSDATKLDNYIYRIRNVLFCLNVVIIIVGIIVGGLCLWMRFDTDFRHWIDVLQIKDVYIGAYILLIFAFLKIASGIFACIAAVSEDVTFLTVNAGCQMFCFLVGLTGAAVLMDYSTYQSAIHPIIEKVMLYLIQGYPQNDHVTHVLLNVQEEMGCCGANGPNDYINMQRALPVECRDTVTGNAFFYGCADEITWYLEQKSSWISGIAIALSSVSVLDAVLSLILAQLRKKEADATKNLHDFSSR